MRTSDPTLIPAANGFVLAYSQNTELRASGGHSTFACGVCHDPHGSITYDRANGLRNDCPVCHTDHGLAGHRGITYERDGYKEQLSCVSCHMPFATRTASSAPSAITADEGRVGDTRTHIFRINVQPVTFTSFFTADGSAVALDSQGRAAVTLDFVCLRCHNSGQANDNAPTFPLAQLSQIATNIHPKLDEGTVVPP